MQCRVPSAAHMNHPCSEAVEQGVGLPSSCLINHNLTNPGKAGKDQDFLTQGLGSVLWKVSFLMARMV